VPVAGATVGEALRELATTFPPLLRHLYGDDGRLRSYVNIYVNEEDVRWLEGERTPLREGDTLTIVPSIAGGAGVPADDASPGLEAPSAPGKDASRGLEALTPPELARYARHLALAEVGPEGQARLKAARVLIVGAGGLGSPVGLYLAAAGVGTIGLVDCDEVDASNLQRQVLYGESDLGRRKTEAAAARLADLNPHVRIVRHDLRLTRENALDVVGAYDIVVDGTDNFPTRYLVNDACVLLGKPYVYGSILRFDGQVSVFDARTGPCYRCLFREPPPPGLVPSCAEGGVLGVLPGIIGSLQALEAIKLILDRGDVLRGRLLLFDALAVGFRELRLHKNPECPVCGEHPTVTELIDYDDFCGLRAEAAPDRAAPTHAAVAGGPHDDVAATDAELPDELSPVELKQLLDAGTDIDLVDIREPFEWRIANLEPLGARLIPMGQLAARLEELRGDRPLVLYCHHGVRSARALAALRAAGIPRVSHLEGGIAAWTAQVDPSLRRY
jgi:adenylyltransferase/sulfurtransferase